MNIFNNFIYEREEKFFGKLTDVVAKMCYAITMNPMSEFISIRLLDRKCYEGVLKIKAIRLPIYEIQEFVQSTYTSSSEYFINQFRKYIFFYKL